MLTWVKKVFAAQEKPPLFTPTEAEYYILSVYAGLITKENLSHEYHYKIAGHLEKAVFQGFGEIKDITVDRWETLRGLRRHIYVFSAAKQYSQVREMSAFINTIGDVSQFREFNELASKVFDIYNKTYLGSEYRTAVGQAEMARQWSDFEAKKDTFPMLKYHTQQDAHVRDEHAMLDGITRAVDDKFWDTYMPKNGWNCRCFVTQHEEGETEVPELPEWGSDKFPKVFRMNPGKDQLIFNPKFHPYFRVARGDVDLRANNFNMPYE